MISEHSAHSTPQPFGIRTWLWQYTCFVVVNFEALAQASDFQIERRRVVFLCWMQDSNPEGLWNRISNRLNAHWQTNWAIEDQAKKLESLMFKPIIQNSCLDTCSEIALRWVPQNVTDTKSALFNVMLGAIMQQAITKADLDPDICCYISWHH